MNLLIITLLLCVFIPLNFVKAQFGIKKKIPKNVIQEEGAERGVINDNKNGNEAIDLNDPELQEAIEMFQNMSPQEMMETIELLKEDPIYKNDPSLLQELDSILEELSQLNEDEIRRNLDDILHEETVAQSIVETMDMLKNTDEKDWQKIIDNKDLILDSVIASGIMSEEEIDLFKNDKKAWEEELKGIWAELKAQADVAIASDEL